MAKLKSRLELLKENFYIQTLGKILEKEVNIRITERRLLIFKPNDANYAEADKSLPELKKGLENLNDIFDVIKEMIKEEEKSAKNV